jgi:sulfite reductase alpha subunit-like flavoprotein
LTSSPSLHSSNLLQQQQQKQSIYNNSGALTNVRFSVFGLGNSSYPKFCSYAKFLDTCFGELGAERIYELGLGDELCGQEESFRRWCASAFKSAVDAFCIDTDKEFIDSLSRDQQEHSWSPQTVRLTPLGEPTATPRPPSLCEALSKLHSRKILPCRLKARCNLQKENSGRVTLKCDLNTHGSSSELQYRPGDHVGLLAANRVDLVDAVLAKVTNAPPPDQLIKVEILKEKTTAFGKQSDCNYICFIKP